EDAAYKRIQAARLAREFPVVFELLADGRLHLTGVGLLAPYLTHENADTLLNAALHKTKSEIELLLAERFPRSEMLPLVQAIPASASKSDRQLAPAQVETWAPQLAPAQVAAPSGRLAPTAPERFLLELTIGRHTHDKLRRLQELLSHSV